MRRLRRPNFVPKTLCDAGKGGRRAASNLQAWRDGCVDEIKFDAHWGEPDVRGALHSMQGLVCAYCHRELDQQRGEVDHFRPKAGGKGDGHNGYWWLAYTFDNCFLSCRPCNGKSSKGDKFPLAEMGMRAKPLDEASLRDELRLFLNPAEDPMDKWMRVVWEDANREGFVTAEKQIAEGSRPALRVNRTIEDLRLNKDIYLRRERQRAIRDAGNALRDGNRSEVQRLCCRYLPHGATAYKFIHEVKRDWLPTPREELLILFAVLKGNLVDAEENLQRFPDDNKPNERIVEELRWAFGFIWKDPPPDALTSDEIAAWIDQHLLKHKADIESKTLGL